MSDRQPRREHRLGAAGACADRGRPWRSARRRRGPDAPRSTSTGQGAECCRRSTRRGRSSGRCSGRRRSVATSWCSAKPQGSRSSRSTSSSATSVVCARGGVRRRFHNLRHLHAACLAVARVPLKVAQGRCGQSTVVITTGIDQHLMAGEGAGAASRVGATVGPLKRDRRYGRRPGGEYREGIQAG